MSTYVYNLKIQFVHDSQHLLTIEFTNRVLKNVIKIIMIIASALYKICLMNNVNEMYCLFFLYFGF